MLGWYLSPGHNRVQNQTSSKVFTEVLYLIDQNYVDSVDQKVLTQKAIESILEQLDPHSVFIPKVDVQVTDAQLESQFEGIGVEFVLQNDTLLVVNTLPSGPSYAAGLRAGDKIISVNGKVIAGTGLTNQKVFKLLRGKRGSAVSLGVLRHQTDSLIKHTVVRDQIQSTSVEVGYMLTPQTGYLKISRFASQTHNEFVQTVDSLKQKGMTQLIIDLRDNPGGLMGQAIDIADELVGGEHLLVYTKGRNMANSQRYYSTPGGIAEHIPTIVLLNEGSASASEVLAGALQDIDRALIMGRRSYGKGLVQAQMGLTDGAKLRLTISRYYTPSGRCIQKTYQDRPTRYYLNDLMHRFDHGELFNKDSIALPDSLTYQTQAGRTVYGGGGIMPDVFVPLDTSLTSALVRRLVAHSLIRHAALNYYATEGATLEKLTPHDFMAKFEPKDKLIHNLRFLAKSQGIEFTEQDWQQNQQNLKHLLKAHLGRAIWRNQVFYPLLHQRDSLINKTHTMWPKAQSLPYFDQANKAKVEN